MRSLYLLILVIIPSCFPLLVRLLNMLDCCGILILIRYVPIFFPFPKYLFQIVPYLPILWFYEDDAGGWLQLRFKLRLNGLFLSDVRTFPCHVCSLDYLVDLSSSQGEDFVLQIPTYPVSFSELMDELDMLNLID